MLKTSAQSEQGHEEDALAAGSTKRKIVLAVLETVAEVGVEGATARAIAAKGGFNQALIFYHFGGSNQVLLAALDLSSIRRLAGYRLMLQEAQEPSEVIRRSKILFEEDLSTGHVRLLLGMLSKSLSDPELAEEMSDRIDPWLALAQEAIERIFPSTSGIAGIPTEPLATAMVALYVGLDALAHLASGKERIAEMFAATGALLHG
ncbi:MAG: TetR/AcrR family transcriptional regulator [Actinomycetota bacterium]|nr:TetR/AcrR family transcriptional regulator [Actinomycetota bacterium]